MNNLNVTRIITTAVVVFVAITAAVNLIIFGYALFLGFKIQGSPDPQSIASFSAAYAPMIAVVNSFFFTFLAALWTSLKVRNKAMVHGHLIGAIVGLLIIVYAMSMSIIFLQKIGHDLLVAPLMPISGYFGAKAGKITENSAPLSGSL